MHGPCVEAVTWSWACTHKGEDVGFEGLRGNRMPFRALPGLADAVDKAAGERLGSGLEPVLGCEGALGFSTFGQSGLWTVAVDARALTR